MNKNQVKAKYDINTQEEIKYSLPEEKDYEILAKVKILEAKKLNKEDAAVVRLIKSQLLDDWRKPLLEELNKLLKKYG